MKLIGHRGCPAHGPENTVQAAVAAARHTDCIEIDVRECGTGEIIVFHDETLERLKSHTGRISETDWQTLSDLTIDNSSETIPRLHTFLDKIPDDTAINIELKESGIAHSVVEMAEAVENEILISSFSMEALNEVQEISDMDCAYLFQTHWAESVLYAFREDCEYIHPHHELLSEKRMEQARDLSFKVNSWTVRSSEVMEKLRALEVDGAITDDWEL